MKKIFLPLVLMLFAQATFAQQLSLNSQYMMNRFVLNPAIAGNYNYVPINFNIRKQWDGINGAPVSQSLSAHSYLGSNVGLGGYFFNDVTGPTRRTGMNVSVSYQLKLNSDFSRKLSFGLSGVFFQHFVDKDKLTTNEPDDIAITNGFNNQFCPDANFGVYLSQTNKYYLGFSIQNLLEVKKDLFDMNRLVDNPVERTYYANGGYTFKLNDDFVFEPSFLLQFQETTPIQMDFNGRFGYKNKFWLGGSYRMNDAAVVMVGLDFDDFCIGYSYDITMSDIKNYSSGSHEINLTYRIYKKGALRQNCKSTPLFN